MFITVPSTISISKNLEVEYNDSDFASDYEQVNLFEAFSRETTPATEEEV
jgi:hypothetical protein